MVRLVFRPYTNVLRTICTLVSLRASIRVSPRGGRHLLPPVCACAARVRKKVCGIYCQHSPCPYCSSQAHMMRRFANMHAVCTNLLAQTRPFASFRMPAIAFILSSHKQQHRSCATGSQLFKAVTPMTTTTQLPFVFFRSSPTPQ